MQEHLYQFLHWLPAIILVCLIVLYLRGVVGPYRAAGDSWRTMDRDVRMAFLLVVPLFRGGIEILLLIDRMFYVPKAELREQSSDHKTSAVQQFRD